MIARLTRWLRYRRRFSQLAAARRRAGYALTEGAVQKYRRWARCSAGYER